MKSHSDPVFLDSYVTLRRGVLEGGASLRSIVHNEPQRLRLEAFVPAFPTDKKDGKAEKVDRIEDAKRKIQELTGDLDGFMDVLSCMLPAREPRSLADKVHALRMLVRAVAHEWDDKLEPYRLKDDARRALGLVMKKARNWLSHSKALHDLNERDAAFLLMVNMRAWFDLEPQPQRFENILLSLWPDAGVAPKDLVSAMDQRYAEVCPNERMHDHAKGNLFSRTVSEKMKTGEGAGMSDDGMTLLYQIFWYEMSKPGNAHYFLPDISWMAATRNKASFLVTLGRGIAKRSFPSLP